MLSLSDCSSYEYQPLDDDGRSFRLLELFPGDFGAPLYGRILTSRIDDINYEALSYVWGPQEPRFELFIKQTDEDISILQIGPNLHEALQHLRPATVVGEPRIMWIDRICINQQDDEEKSKQVAFMHTIYTKCQKCTVWLGEGLQNGTDIKLLAKYISENQAALNDASSSEFQKLLLECGASDTSLDYIKQCMNQAYDLADREWFDRAWTFQEAILPPGVEVQFGSVAIPVDHICAFESLGTMHGTWASLQRTREEHRALQELDLLGLFEGRLNKSACDPRDKVYSLLGLLPNAFRRALIPDYTILASSVFTTLARTNIISTTRLTYLLFREEPRYQDSDVCPSWVPDWRAPGEYPQYNHMASIRDRMSQATLGSGIAFVPDDDQKSLRIYGISLDIVTLIGPYRDAHTISDYELGAIYAWTNQPIIAALRQAALLEEWMLFRIGTISSRDPGRPSYEQFFGISQRSESCTICATEHPLPDKSVQSIEKDSWDSWSPGLLEQLKRCYKETLGWRSLFVTKDGIIGFANNAQPGDIIYCLFGSHVPLLMRPLKNNRQNTTTYELVGPCFAHGFMFGEAIYRRTGARPFNPELYPGSEADGVWNLNESERHHVAEWTVTSADGQKLNPDGSPLASDSRLDFKQASDDPNARFFHFLDREGISGTVEGELITIV